jgi:hypothetical protein
MGNKVFWRQWPKKTSSHKKDLFPQKRVLLAGSVCCGCGKATAHENAETPSSGVW